MVGGIQRAGRLDDVPLFSRLIVATRCNADEQAFIFARRNFRVQVAQVRKARIERQRNARRVLAGIGGLRCRQPTLRPLAPKQKVSQSFQADLPGPVLREKRILFSRDRKSVLELPLSRPARGAYRDRHERWAGAAVDAKAPGARCGSQGGFSRERSVARRTNGAVAYGKTVWSWHPWLVSSRRRFAELNRAMRAANSPATEARRIRLRGERGISRQTIAQGRPDAPADACMLVCVFLRLLHTRPRVPASTRPSLRPLISWGAEEFRAKLGRYAPRRGNADVHGLSSARMEGDSAIRDLSPR